MLYFNYLYFLISFLFLVCKKYLIPEVLLFSVTELQKISTQNINPMHAIHHSNV
ncbi:MAG: hypothetical protein QG610_2534 [Euryarchaeota archaeon]|nr:hypothetical protein [Euryarchaeota archaeon]